MTKSVSEIFRDRFRELVDAKGIALEQCAKEMGIPFSTFKYMYTHGRKRDLNVLIRIAKYFDVSTDYLLGLTDEKNKKGT